MTVKGLFNQTNNIVEIIENCKPDHLDVYQNNSMYRNMCRNAEILGELGWILPLMSKPVKDMIKTTPKKHIDNKMISYYGKEQFLVAINFIRDSDLSEYRKNVFEQAYKAIESELYYPAYSALTAQLEGVLADLTSQEHESWYKKINKIENIIPNEADLMKMLFYLSLKKFVHEFNKNISFDKEESELLNRNWVLHGRTKKAICFIDCLKLINSLYALLYIIKKEPETQI